MNNEDNKFIEYHLPCPDAETCGSSDGASKNADGSLFCFACNKFFPSKGGTVVALKKEAVTKPVLHDDFGYSPLTDRRINVGTAKKYGVLVTSLSTGEITQHAYPYLSKDTGDTNYKLRDVKAKGFTWAGSPKGTTLFGQHLFRAGGKFITLVEGECDALAAYQLLGSKWAVVSIKNGAAGAVRDVKENLEYLESFDNVVINFDSDEAGQAAAQAVAQLLTPSKAKIMSMPTGFKDANDMLKANKITDYVSHWWDAKVYRPDGVLNASEELTNYLEYERKPCIPYPWDGLNAKLEGIRLGELTTITGGTGLGKSTVTRELTHWLLTQADSPIGVMALEENWRRTVDGLLGIEANVLMHKAEIREGYSKEAIAEVYERIILPDKLWIHSHHGVTDIESIFSKLRYLIVGCGCKYIVLDHLHMLVLAHKEVDERLGIDNIMGRLSSLCEETNTSIFLVSHLKRVEGNRGHEDGVQTSISHLRGSQSIAQLSHNVVSIERNQQAEDPIEASTSYLRVLKSRETGTVGLACAVMYDSVTGRLKETDMNDEFAGEL